MAMRALKFSSLAACIATADDTSFVQKTLDSLTGSTPGLALPNALPAMGTQNVTVPKFIQYRLLISSTWGADHACMTELEFLDGERNQMQARYLYMSSCYGCPIACEECQAKWGNPLAQFDMITTVDDGASWSCTAPGTFPGGKGEQTIAFTLKERPAKAIIHSAHVNGDWQPRDFKLQEQQLDKTWKTVGLMANAPKTTEQGFFVQWMGSFEEPALWPIDFAKCGGLTHAEPLQVVAESPPLSASFSPLTDRALVSNGMPGGVKHGMTIAGDFGNVSLPSGLFAVRQITFNFPSNRQIPGHDVAEGEMQLICQRMGSVGLFDPAVVVVPLELPQEGTAVSPTELFFKDAGLNELPIKGVPKKLDMPLDLSAFLPQFGTQVQKLNCSDNVPWYVLTTPATVSGSVILSFKNGPVVLNATELNMTGTAKTCLDECLYETDKHMCMEQCQARLLQEADAALAAAEANAAASAALTATTSTVPTIVWGAGGKIISGRSSSLLGGAATEKAAASTEEELIAHDKLLKAEYAPAPEDPVWKA